ncbi:MAG: JAB domain-containing protein [Alistipes sp.]|nr:JAB domain-containing protein [Alistipes sp.]
MTIKLTSEEKKLQVTDPKDLYPILQRILKRENKIDRQKEHFWMAGLNTVGSLLFVELACLGSINKVVVHPPSIYRVAVVKGASYIIAAHNHPGGSLKFSGQDIDLTDRLIQAGKILDLELLDHMVITENSFASMRSMGIFSEIENSTKYAPGYVQFDLGVQRERDKIVRVVAKNLIERRMPVMQVAESLGIGIAELERILSEN